jgi:pimeloyl-ACP methyl ester carboxylesterase
LAVVLVHGGSAHRHWWDHIAPVIARDHGVVAIDLSGHGDSDRRPVYNFEAWAGEVVAGFAAERPSAYALGQPGCRVAFFRPEFGIMSADTAALVYERFGPGTPIIEIPDAAHHVMFDQPLGLVMGLRTVLALWSRDLAHRDGPTTSCPKTGAGIDRGLRDTRPHHDR